MNKRHKKIKQNHYIKSCTTYVIQNNKKNEISKILKLFTPNFP